MAKLKSDARKEIAGTIKDTRRRSPKPPPEVQPVPRKVAAEKDKPAKVAAKRPRKTPTPHKEKSGTLVVLPLGFPDPPDDLKPGARACYYRIAEHIAEAKALFPIDSLIIAQAAYWLDLMKRTLDQHGEDFISVYPNGTKQVSPYFTIIDKAEAHATKYFRLLGIGPKARQELLAFNAGKAPGAGDPFDEFLKGHGETPEE